MADKRESPEELGGRSRGLNKKDKIERLSLLKKDSKNFAKRILNNNDITLLLGREKSNILHDVITCADYLKIRHFLLTGEKKVVHARLCKRHLLCSFCAHLRASKIIQKFLKIYKEIQQNQKSYHVIFTIKNGEDLKERFNHLNKSITLLMAGRRQGRGELSKISAGVYSYEVTRGKDSLWHPHIHSIFLTSHFISFSDIRAEWKKITGDSFEVHVKEFYGNDNEEKLIIPFLEVFKYALKISSMDDLDRLEVLKVLSGRKLINSFGDFRGFKEPVNLLDEVSKDDVFYMDLILQYEDINGYMPIDHVEFSKEFRSIFKLQNLWKKHGDKILDRIFTPMAFDIIQERTGVDCRGFIIEMIKSNLSDMQQVEEFLKKKGGKLLEGSPEPMVSAPETETDIQEWISKAIYNETDEKKG